MAPTPYNFMRIDHSVVNTSRTLKSIITCCKTRDVHNNHHQPFVEILQRSLYELNSRLASYVRQGDPTVAWALFHHMHCQAHSLNAYTFTPILGACSVLQCTARGEQVHGLMIKMGTDLGTVTKTALMDMYSKYGYVGSCVRVFEEMECKDVVTWNALLSNYLRHGLAHEALGVFQAMKKEKFVISEVTLCSVLKTCAFLKSSRQGLQVHGLVVIMGRDLVILGTALIDFYSGVGKINEALKVYSSLKCKKDDVMHNALISGCIRHQRYEEALAIMCTLEPNVVALTSALAACSENSDVWIGKQIHCVAIRQEFTSNTQLCNVLLDMYAKCGKVLHARLLFDGIKNKDVVCWTSMIDAYRIHGCGVEAVELFRKMMEQGSGVLPNLVTFLGVLSACGHTGMADQAREFFRMMKDKYALEPGPEHYACFIDIMGRAGQMQEVWSVFHTIVEQGIKPTSGLWTALLHVCKLNMDMRGAEFAAKHLLESDPDKASSYVLLSNYYADIGRWDIVDELRNLMRTKGLVKEAGNSWFSATHFHETADRAFA